jgi:hypothetical protein
MTQHQLILAHIDTYGSISPMEAFMKYGITKLATRISELRRQGHMIIKVREESKNRFGQKIHYMRYRRAA